MVETTLGSKPSAYFVRLHLHRMGRRGDLVTRFASPARSYWNLAWHLCLSRQKVRNKTQRVVGMAKALDVARYLIHLANSEDEPDLLTHLRLQKLLYYCQGWFLGLTSRQLFPERIEAWVHGPVVVSLYPHFADYGFCSIPPDSFPFDETQTTLSDGEREFVESVWQVYREYSGSSLREMTHSEATWLDARRGLQPAERGSSEITADAMREFFKKQAV